MPKPVFILARARRVAFQARRLPRTAKAARVWLALAAAHAARRHEGALARELADLEASIL